MPIRKCRIFDAEVDIENGFFVTKNKPINRGVLNNSGYFLINLKRKGEKKHSVYTMQLSIYLEANNIQKIPEGFCLHHQDECTGNNKIGNICLCTHSYNSYCAAKNRDYVKIYEKRKENGFTQKVQATDPEGNIQLFDSISKCARAFSVNPGTISKILNKKKYYSTVTFKNKVFTFCRA